MFSLRLVSPVALCNKIEVVRESASHQPRTAHPPLLDARRCLVGHDDVDDICDVRPRVWPPADSCPDGTMIFRATDFDFDIINRTRPSPARLVSMPHGTERRTCILRVRTPSRVCAPLAAARSVTVESRSGN